MANVDKADKSHKKVLKSWHPHLYKKLERLKKQVKQNNTVALHPWETFSEWHSKKKKKTKKTLKYKENTLKYQKTWKIFLNHGQHLHMKWHSENTIYRVWGQFKFQMTYTSFIP